VGSRLSGFESLWLGDEDTLRANQWRNAKRAADALHDPTTDLETNGLMKPTWKPCQPTLLQKLVPERTNTALVAGRESASLISMTIRRNLLQRSFRIDEMTVDFTVRR
jgi:hypothetical protein